MEKGFVEEEVNKEVKASHCKEETQVNIHQSAQELGFPMGENDILCI